MDFDKTSKLGNGVDAQIGDCLLERLHLTFELGVADVDAEAATGGDLLAEQFRESFFQVGDVPTQPLVRIAEVEILGLQ